MGTSLGKRIDDRLKTNQDFMLAAQRAMMERQMHMQNALREQQMAIQIARSRDLFTWWASFYTVASTGAILGFIRSKNRLMLVPLVPLTFVVGYFGDLAYGTKITRIKAEAFSILQNETHLLDLPLPLPSIEDLDRRRDDQNRS